MLRLFIVLSVLTLSACQKSPPNTQSVRDEGFSAKGRIGLLSGEGNFNASFFYSASNNVERLELWGPAGSGHIIITSTDGFAALTDGSGQYYQSDNIDTLIVDHVGYPVPATSLGYWLKGSADPNIGVEQQEHYDSGHLKSLVQQDWNINYGNWAQAGNFFHPEKLKALDSARNIRISIKINEWNAKK